ncbi:MAG: hypothetical protein E7533_08025 [Ruminococcaceae bacterium]|nr:hypothetical protein [Oscillospiraceae bacterium]
MKRIITVATSILLVSALLLTLTSCGSSGGIEETKPYETEEAVYTEGATQVGKTSEEVLAYFNSLINGVKVDMPAVSYNIEKNVPNDSLKVTKRGAEEAEEIDSSLKALNDGAKGIKDLILQDIKSTSGDIAYGADNTETLFVQGESWASKLTSEDIAYATLKEVGDQYFITIAFNDLTSAEAQAVLTKAFDLRDKEEILASEEFAKTKEYLALEDYDVVYSGCKITATVDRLTDKITNINYYKAANVTAYMTGAGTLESYGELSVLFTLEDKADFNITWETELPTSPLETEAEAVAE